MADNTISSNAPHVSATAPDAAQGGSEPPASFWSGWGPTLIRGAVALVGGLIGIKGRQGVGAVGGALAGFVALGAAAHTALKFVQSGAVSFGDSWTDVKFDKTKMPSFGDVLGFDYQAAAERVKSGLEYVVNAIAPVPDIKSVEDVERFIANKSFRVSTDGAIFNGKPDGVKSVIVCDEHGTELPADVARIAFDDKNVARIAWGPEFGEGQTVHGLVAFTKTVDEAGVQLQKDLSAAFQVARPVLGPLGAKRELEAVQEMLKTGLPLVVTADAAASIPKLSELFLCAGAALPETHPARHELAVLSSVIAGLPKDAADLDEQLLAVLQRVKTLTAGAPDYEPTPEAQRDDVAVSEAVHSHLAPRILRAATRNDAFQQVISAIATQSSGDLPIARLAQAFAETPAIDRRVAAMLLQKFAEARIVLCPTPAEPAPEPAEAQAQANAAPAGAPNSIGDMLAGLFAQMNPDAGRT